ncbi:MAG: choice-of-anchor E domain-containing protein [Myxococcota bacterium]
MARNTRPLLALSALIVASWLQAAAAGAAVDFYVDDETGWVAAWEAVASQGAPAVVYFDTTAANVALASEVSSTPGPNTGLGPRLTFEPQDTGMCHRFRVRTLQSGAGFTFDDDEGSGNLPNFDDALSIGDIDNHQIDGFELSLHGPPIYALAFRITDNAGEPFEGISVWDGIDDSVPIGQFDTSSLDSFTIGIVSDTPIASVRFQEGTGGDDVAVKDFRFGDARAHDSDGDGVTDCDEMGTLARSATLSDDRAYTISETAVELLPGVGWDGSSTGRDVEYQTTQVQKFDPALGTLTGVRVEVTGTTQLAHSRSGQCGTIGLIPLCNLTITTETDTDFGVGVAGYDPGGADPPLINGVPAWPTADVWERKGLETEVTNFGIVAETSPVTSNGSVTFDFDVPVGQIANFVGTGSFSVATEILSETTITLECGWAVLAVCDAVTLVEQEFDVAITVTYTYEKAVNVRFYVDDLAGWQADTPQAENLVLTTSAAMPQFNEVSSPPGANVNVGNTLTFDVDPSQACRGFTLRTLQSGANFTFDDDEGAGNLVNFDNALSVGDLDNHENDDFEISFPSDGPPAFAASFVLEDSHGTIGEELRVYDLDDALIGVLGGASFAGGEKKTLGVLSDVPIGRIVFDEDSGGDDVAIDTFRFDEGYGDYDGDGLNDCDEATYYDTDPLEVDSDADGLDDFEELILGTDPNLYDTDGDGPGDGTEVTAGTDPLDPESHPVKVPLFGPLAQGGLALLLLACARRFVPARS